MLKFLYSRTQNVAVPLCTGPPLNSEVWIWSQVSSFGICDLFCHFNRFLFEYLCFPLSVYHTSSAPYSFHIRSSTLYLSPWQLTTLWNNTHTGEEASIQDFWDVTRFRMSGSRRFEGSRCLQLNGKKKQSKNPRQHRHDNLTFRILKGFNAKRNYPTGFYNVFPHCVIKGPIF